MGVYVCVCVYVYVYVYVCVCLCVCLSVRLFSLALSLSLSMSLCVAACNPPLQAAKCGRTFVSAIAFCMTGLAVSASSATLLSPLRTM